MGAIADSFGAAVKACCARRRSHSGRQSFPHRPRHSNSLERPPMAAPQSGQIRLRIADSKSVLKRTFPSPSSATSVVDRRR